VDSIKFAIMEVAITLVMGPSSPAAGIISKGSSTTFIQNMPRGGIHAVLRIRSTVTVDCDTYSTQPVQNMVRQRLTQGATIHPRSANNICDSDGMYRLIPRLNRVSITP